MGVDGDKVFDLEIEDTHCFFADGVLVHNCMIRRTKQEVLPDLPPKRRHVVPFEIPKNSEYWEAEKDLIGWLAKKDMERAIRAARAERYTKLTYLKHEAAKAKLPSVIAWVEDFLNQSDGKLLLGTIHTSTVHKVLFERFKGVAVEISGKKSEKERKRAEVAFKDLKGARLLVGQIKAAGLGLNLQECTTVGFPELPWTSGACQQFIDRCHRLSSVDPVDAYFFIAHETIEDVLCGIIQRKQEHSDMILDGVAVRDDSLTVYDELHEALLQKGKSR